MRSVITVVTGMLLTAAASCSYAQAQPSGTPGKTPAVAQRPATKQAAKPKAKPVSKKHSASGATATSGKQAPEGGVVKSGRRDPFESLVGRQKAEADAAKNLPPGKGGLQVSTLKVDGIVRAPNGMIGVVSNPQQRTYFLREGDQLYDGRVDKIAMDGISFHESGKDAFGKPVERQVNKRIYTSAGEEQ